MAVTVRTRQQALTEVARHIGGHLQAMSEQERAQMFGFQFNEDTGEYEGVKPTVAEEERMNWAVDEVTRRVYAIGGRS